MVLNKMFSEQARRDLVRTIWENSIGGKHPGAINGRVVDGEFKSVGQATSYEHYRLARDDELMDFSDGVLMETEQRITPRWNRLYSVGIREMSEAGFHMGPVLEDRTYTIGPSTQGNAVLPDRIYEDGVKDFLKICDGLVSNDGSDKEKRRIDFARAILNRDGSFNLADVMGALTKQTRALVKQRIGENSKTTIYDLAVNLPAYREMREWAISELSAIVEARRRGKTVAEDFPHKRFMEKFRPEIYERAMGWNGGLKIPIVNPIVGNCHATLDCLFSLPTASNILGVFTHSAAALGSIARAPKTYWDIQAQERASEPGLGLVENPWGDRKVDTYTIQVTHDPDLFMKVAQGGLYACTRNNPRKYFDASVHEPGSVHLIGSKNGVPRGYSRIFLLRGYAAGGKTFPVLGLDTIEVPRKTFALETPFVSAFTLATIQLARDMQARAVLGGDARISVGPRQAYNNTKPSFDTSKLGFTPPLYFTFGSKPIKNNKPYVLFEDWRKNGSS